ncbi:acetyl-CoA synthetase [Diplogelasinospora grovesii]|uniref:Acetyl-CoA synthetase n=1 Tax=Diplogelasinospora grovesii TaxID=303347 RepID=A0AAN6N5U0_9PEZI|nr:acetyl-CoA synthetase [Diplogelasinospora grovesii]
MPTPTLKTSVVDLVDNWAANTPDASAAIWDGQTLTYAELRSASLHVSDALLSVGGDLRGAHVPLLTQMSLEMLPAIIGILRVGACHVPMDVAAWSRSRIEAALGQVSPRVAVATSSVDGLQLPLPPTVHFRKEWLRSPFVNKQAFSDQLGDIRRGLGPEDLAYIIFTSGTTGKPKGVLVAHRSIRFLVSLGDGDVIKPSPGKHILLTFSVAFDGCAGIVWTTLTNGATLAMASASNFPAIATTCQILILTPSMLAALDPAGGYEGVQEIYLGGEAPSLSVVRQWITPKRNVIQMDPDNEPVLGQIIPGVKVVLVDENMQEAEVGEIMIAGPCLAVGYMKSPELTAKKFIVWNGERFYRTGDRARRTPRGLVWAGRVDRLVKNRGFLINLESEVEPALLRFPPVRTATAFIWRDKLVGFVQPSTVNTDELRTFMKTDFDHFVVPDKIIAVDDFPLTANSKVDQSALRTKLDARLVDGEDVLDEEKTLSTRDALRLAVSKILDVPLRELDETSSFTKHGGNSLLAIKLSQFLLKLGCSLSVAQVLKAETIGEMEEACSDRVGSVHSRQDDDPAPESSLAVPMTDMQKLMLSQSQQDISSNCLVIKLNHVGSQVPSPRQLHDAWIKVLSRHDIFQTRFDLGGWALSDLGGLNFGWREIQVYHESEHERAVISHENSAWIDVQGDKGLSLEAPYCHMTCISVPCRRATIIWRVHHILTDAFSSAILLQDLNRTLAGEELGAGPRYRDFALFFQKYKRENLERAIHLWERTLSCLSTKPVLHIPAPPTRLADSSLMDMRRFSTAIQKTALDAAVRSYAVSSTTLVFSALTASGAGASFVLSLSGRMLPWPLASSLVGSMHVRAPFRTAVPATATVRDWIAEVHSELLNVYELQNLASSLPPSISETQPPVVPLRWRVFEDAGTVICELKTDKKKVDLGWAERAGDVAARALEGLVHAPHDSRVRVEDL